MPKPIPPAANMAPIASTMAVKCHRYRVMIEPFTRIVPVHAAGRCRIRCALGSSASKVATCIVPKAISARVGGALLEASAPGTPTMATG